MICGLRQDLRWCNSTPECDSSYRYIVRTEPVKMRILVVAPDYPKPGSPLGGSFNEGSAIALKEIGNDVEVLVPRPYAPSLVSSLRPRWKVYASTPAHEVKKGIPITRPAYPQIPRLGGALWMDWLIFRFCRPIARKAHQKANFRGIISFDLGGAGGLAWRLGQDLGIPAAGWATGGDLRVSASSGAGKIVLRALRSLDIVFYQSSELLQKSADLLGVPVSQMARDRHVVLPRGIPTPPRLPKVQTRNRIRMGLGIVEDDVLVVNVGRISRPKGIFDLINAVSLANAKNKRIKCVLLGSNPAFDDTTTVMQFLDKMSHLKRHVTILPACSHDKVWEYLCAADIFAFTSYHEGMPNSLLEAMAMGIPSVAFAIPPVREIEAGTGGIILVTERKSEPFARALLNLASSPDEQRRIGDIGRRRVEQGFMIRTSMADAARHLDHLIERRELLGLDSSRTYTRIQRAANGHRQ
jgi:teichuronic acid biosynthesis glycosyltransferase TuaC